jgi:hypothetical protein
MNSLGIVKNENLAYTTTNKFFSPRTKPTAD